jgi:hypothetical protein
MCYLWQWSQERDFVLQILYQFDRRFTGCDAWRSWTLWRKILIWRDPDRFIFTPKLAGRPQKNQWTLYVVMFMDACDPLRIVSGVQFTGTCDAWLNLRSNWYSMAMYGEILLSSGERSTSPDTITLWFHVQLHRHRENSSLDWNCQLHLASMFPFARIQPNWRTTSYNRPTVGTITFIEA